MDEERLVARLRHLSPSVTVTELHIDRIDHDRKTQVIDYLHCLRLKPSVESSAGLETVVSVDISSSNEQHELFDRFVSFVRGLGVGEVSISKEPFDERQPEIEATEESFIGTDSLSRGHTTVDNEDTEDLFSQDKSESEYEIIINHPGQCSSAGSRRLALHQSSKDVIRSLLRVNQAQQSDERSESSECCSLLQQDLEYSKRNSVHIQGQTSQQAKGKTTFWTKAKNIFKRKKAEDVHTVQYFHLQLSTENVETKSRKSDSTILSTHGYLATGREQRPVSINTLQERLERVSQDLFNLKNRCSKSMNASLSLEAWTQTSHQITGYEDWKETSTQTRDVKHSNLTSSKETEMTSSTCFTESRQSATSGERTFSQITFSTESDLRRDWRRFGPARGMLTNNFKHPIIYSFKPVGDINNGGTIFFRMRRGEPIPKTTWNNIYKSSTTPSSLRSLCSASSSPFFISSTSNVTVINMGSEKERTLSETDVDLNSSIPSEEAENVNCGIICTSGKSPFMPDKDFRHLQVPKITQTTEPDLVAVDINTSGVFKLQKTTQTRSSGKPKMTCTEPHKLETVGTQTSSCSSSTSCSELVNTRSCGTNTEDGDKVNRSSICDIIPRKTESKEAAVEVDVECESCKSKSSDSSSRNRKSAGRFHGQLRAIKPGLVWGQFPDGKYGFGQEYAPGKVAPLMAWGDSLTSPSDPLPQEPANQKCPKICNIFGGRKSALKEELKRQNLELHQLKMILIAINDEILAENTETSSEENYPSSHKQEPPKPTKKVTFKDPLVD